MSGLRSIMLGCIITILFSATAAMAQTSSSAGKIPNGSEFVSSLKFYSLTVSVVSKVATGKVTFSNESEKKPLEIPVRSMQVFKSTDVSSGPLSFIKNHEFKTGDNCRIVRFRGVYYVMLEIPEYDAAEGTGGDGRKAQDQSTGRIPTFEEVKQVFKLDTKEKQTEFDLLRKADRDKLLIVAAMISGLKDAPSLKESEFDLAPCERFMDRKLLNAWLMKNGENKNALQFIKLMRVPAEKHDFVRLRFGTMRVNQCMAAVETANALQKKPLGELDDYQKEFVSSNRDLFNLE